MPVGSERYEIRSNETIKKEQSSLGWDYTVTFYSCQYRLQDVLFFLLGNPDRKKYHDYYNGTATQWLELVVSNMNRVDGGWSAGSSIESKPINMPFLDKSCADVLTGICDELDTEF
ncbi:hypothetical protein FACS1894181_19030 [Bacteroidia bacterium]|nr:hypothetical protein FACS1894181_19030 [Bacteroidia bacterium]